VKIDILGSGSRGNAIVVDGEDDDGAVLIDCGFGPRILASRMTAAGVDPHEVQGVIVTHEHADHAAGLHKAVRRWHWPVAATAGTAVGLASPVTLAHRLTRGRTLHLAGMIIETIRTPHDATESVAFVLTHERSGCRVAFVYDLGHWTPTMAQRLNGLDAIIVESNHDDDMLHAGNYPPFLKARVAGPKGHLSNMEAAALARAVVHRGLGTIVLAHLSEENNTPALALGAMRNGLHGTSFRGRLGIAHQDRLVHFTVGSSSRTRQLSLGL